MSTNVSVNTYTYSVTYVTQQMMRSIKLILMMSGLSLENLRDGWASVELAINTWLASGDLEKVTIEIYKPASGALVTRWDFEIDYSYSTADDGALWADPEAISAAIRKAGAVASTCEYEFKLLAPGGPKVPGWGPVPYRSTVGFNQHSVGTTISGSPIAATTTFWSKTS